MSILSLSAHVDSNKHKQWEIGSQLSGDKPMELDSDIVHVWKVDLAQGCENREKCWSILTKDERQRAQRFRTQQLQRRFVVCRGQLRLLLAGYLSMPPSSVEFDLGEHGKPRLAGTSLNQGLVFNISHSSDTALFAVAHDRALGVDVEVWRTIRNMEALVERWFAPREKAYWYSLEPSERSNAFFRIWTCKESFVKAVGRGISLGIEHCEVDTVEQWQFNKVPTECGMPSAWWLEEIEMSSGISAAITTNNPPCTIVHRQLYQ